MLQHGGTDLLVQIVKLYKKNIKISNLLMILDIIIVSLNIIVFKQLEIGLYSAITIYIVGKMLDIFFEGINFSKIVFIISPEYSKISNKIAIEIRRGSTLLYGNGMYKNEKRNTLMCVVSRGEVRQIMRYYKKYR